MITHEYQLRILREGGVPVGDPVPLSLRGPLQRGAEALRWRSFIGGDAAMETPVRVSPRWSDSGEPLVQALAFEAGAIRLAMPAKPLFAGAAKAESARLVEAGVLEEGGAYGFVITAAPGAAENEPSVFQLDAYPVTPAAHGVDGMVRDPEHADPRDVPVLIENGPLGEALRIAEHSGDEESGGVLFGKLQRDPTGAVALVVTHLCPAVHGKGAKHSFTFTPETWSMAAAALERRNAGEVMVGSFHTHPDFCKDCEPERRNVCAMRRPFFSEDDIRLHESVFPAAYSVGLLVSNDGSSLTPSLWGWRDGFVIRRSYLTSI